MKNYKILNYTYNFNGEQESQFKTAFDNMHNLLKVANIVSNNCNSLKENYLHAVNMEKLIEDNMFIPNYKNKIYKNEHSVGEKRVSKDEIFTLDSDVNTILRKLTSWIEQTPDLYSYNNMKVSHHSTTF